jgi:hypothetical protein
MKELSMDKQRQEEIIKALQEKEANEMCPRCGHFEFDVVGEAEIPLVTRRRGSWVAGSL